MRILPLLILAACLSGCAAAPAQYAGSPGSTYDKVREPPHTVAPATYDALAPIAPLAFGNGGQTFDRPAAAVR